MPHEENRRAKFEWAWQHPKESLAVRKAAASFKSLSGIANKIKLAYTMLTLPAWQSLNITVNYFSTKYTNHYAGCPSLPEHMKVQVRAMDEIPCYSELIDVSFSENEDEWNNKEDCEGGTSSTASGFVQETIPDSMVRNSSDNEINIIDKTAEFLYGRGNELEEDCAQPSSFIKSASIATSSYSLEEVAEGRDIAAASVELQLPVVTAGYSAQPPSSSYAAPQYVEIIDISTPSPDCRTSLCGKKRRISTICPQIIDLTKSPAFVQL